jgi:diaminopimelate decarboxylase
MKSTLDGFSWSGGSFFCEDVPLERIAAEVGTPAYVYSRSGLVNRVRRLQSSLGELDAQVYFAVKACGNLHVLGLLGQLGCGADIVSGGELFRASLALIPPERVVFSGVGKTEREISEALDAEIHMFNVESLEELLTIERLASDSGRKARVSLRVNPNVDAKTHPYISTGLKKNKFGLSGGELQELYRQLPRLRATSVIGLSCHIGSQIMSETPFVKAWTELRRIAEKAPFSPTHLDIGGGLGVPYEGERALTLEQYGRLVGRVFKGSRYRLGLEPGRSLVAPTAVLLTSLVATKSRGSLGFYVVDAGMNDLMRPALYGAVHECLPVKAPRRGATLATVDVVGPVCESSDRFQARARLPRLEAGSLLAFANAGAYGMSMASQYNSRPRAAEVLVDGSTYRVIRARETYADLVQREL